MNEDQTLQAVAAAMCLVLVGSALVSRRLPLGQTVRMVLAWVAIFAAGLLAYSCKDEVTGRLGAVLRPETGQIAGETLILPKNEDGHYWVRAEVNGVETRFLIDSGATTTALSLDAAKAAGIDPAQDSFGTPINTANGTVMGRRVRIDTLKVGPIQRRDVGAVTAAEFGGTNVLGMNFLNSLSGWGVENGKLVLRP